MTSGRGAPPRLATWVIARLLPPAEREDTLGDLAERFHRMVARRGAGPASRWYWKQTLTFVARLAGETPSRRWGRRVSNARPWHKRSVRSSFTVAALLQDLRYAVRTFRKQPFFSLVATATLALGIGASTAVFSVVNGVLLQPLPYQDPGSLVGVWHTAPGIGFDGSLNQAPALYLTYRDESRVFEDIGLWDDQQFTITGVAEPERVMGMLVTDGTLPLLRATPMLGRSFTAEDDTPRTPETVILSYGYWQSRFAGDPRVIGTTLTLDGRPREIIGVMPRDFVFLRSDPAIYVPFRFDRSQTTVGDFSYQGLARLRPGVTLEQANADVDRMIPLAPEKFPGGMPLSFLQRWQLGPDVHPLMLDVVGEVRTVLWVIMGTVAIVLLIACANVANLFLVRTEGRQRELAIRTAVGAGRHQLVRALLLESLSLSILAGIAGLGLADAGIRAFVSLGPQELPRLANIVIDPPVLAVTLAVTLLSGLFFGLFPVLRYTNPNLVTALKEGGRGTEGGTVRSRARNGLVIAQVALALVLIVGSGLMIRSFTAMRLVYPGFDRPGEVLTVRVAIPSAEVPDVVAAAGTHEQILRRIRQLPGVTAAAFSSSLTMDGWDSNTGMYVDGFPLAADAAPPSRRLKWTSPGYFETMGNPILAGRDFTWTDIQTMAPVIVVTESLAREYWPDPAEAVGKRMRENPAHPWREIVGVVGNVYDDGIQDGPTAVVYWPSVVERFWGFDIFTRRSIAYAIRSARTGASGLLDDVRRTVWSVNPNLPVANVRTLQQIYDFSMIQTSYTLVLLAIAAGVALLLGTVGIYGVISYIVSQRTREIGVRMALGARQVDVSRMVLRQGLFLAGTGVVVGLLAAVGLTRLMSALLFGVNPVDPVTYGVVIIVITLIALSASYLPARRAAAVDPTEALRWE
jgi:putative ABC transport system permease protein